jgi:uncharacterized protein YndB with AHSA1/START domain
MGLVASSVFVSVRVKATPGRAFQAFTEEIGRWWHPNGLFAFTRGQPGTIALEPGIGGRFTETQPDGTAFEIGRVIAWEPPHRLVLSWRQASFAEDQSTEVHVRFEPVGDETRVTVEHFGWETIPQEHAARHGFPLGVFLQRHAEWWQILLSRMRVEATRSQE